MIKESDMETSSDRIAREMVIKTEGWGDRTGQGVTEENLQLQ